jgi:16S rRNA (guanine966-N2)-methyltransferase
MREAVFSSLGDAVIGATVLDLYAGTGSFGLEALSRGAAEAVFVERDRSALAALRANIAAVALGGTVSAGDVASALRRERRSFSLVFVDPPYDLPTADLRVALGGLAGLLSEGAIVLVHRRRDGEEPLAEGTLVKTGRRRYGDAEVWWYAKEAQ